MSSCLPLELLCLRSTTLHLPVHFGETRCPDGVRGCLQAKILSEYGSYANGDRGERGTEDGVEPWLLSLTTVGEGFLRIFACKPSRTRSPQAPERLPLGFRSAVHPGPSTRRMQPCCQDPESF
jgi:hypothetical protein